MMRNGHEILRDLAFESGQETSEMPDFEEEIQERLKDLDLIHGKFARSLLIGATASEMIAWYRKFNSIPVGISLDRSVDERRTIALLDKGMRIFFKDMHDLDFPDESFDFIYASQVMEHSPAPLVALTQLYRVLKPNGEGFFWMPADLENLRQEYHYSCFPREVWEDLLSKAGFEVFRLQRRFNSWGYSVKKVAEVKVSEAVRTIAEVMAEIAVAVGIIAGAVEAISLAVEEMETGVEEPVTEEEKVEAIMEEPMIKEPEAEAVIEQEKVGEEGEDI